MGSVPLEAVQRLVDWYLERFSQAPESEPYQLLQGQSNTSVDSSHSLWSLSRSLDAQIREQLRLGAWDQLPEPFAASFNDYLERFSDGSGEGRRRAAQMILGYADHAMPDPYETVHRLAAEREATVVAVRARLLPDEQATFDELLALALAHYRLTEDHNLFLDQQSDGATRRVVEEFGRRLAAYGILDTEEDIAYLMLPELLQWGFGLAEPLRPRVAERKARYAQQCRLRPPAFLGRPPEPSTWVDRFNGPAQPLVAEPGTLRGVGASAGVVRGRARIAKMLEDALDLQPGEVLVCPMTDPRWTPLFALAAALVTDQGGSLAHAAVVARELRLPAVVGTYTATEQLRPSQFLEVDGAQGLVRLEG